MRDFLWTLLIIVVIVLLAHPTITYKMDGIEHKIEWSITNGDKTQ